MDFKINTLLAYLGRLLKEFPESKTFFEEFEKFNEYYYLLEELKEIDRDGEEIYK